MGKRTWHSGRRSVRASRHVLITLPLSAGLKVLVLVLEGNCDLGQNLAKPYRGGVLIGLGP